MQSPADLLAITARSAAPTASRAFAHVEAHLDAAPVLEAWATLEATAPCSIYQTRAWLRAWIDALARPAGLAPAFVLARDAAGRPVALLCLGLRRYGPLRIAGWLGGRDSNFNMPLLAPGGAWTRAEVVRLLRTARLAFGRAAPDLFVLTNQPLAWNGFANPLAHLRHQASPSAAYATALPGNAQARLPGRLSKERRKRLRSKEARLAALGAVTFLRAETDADHARIVDAFLAMRNARFRAQAIASPFESPAMRAFIIAASATTPPGIELHALAVGTRIVAVWGGAAHQGQWSGMFTAFDMDATIAPSSPGEILLQRIVADACGRGLARFDLGIGPARYKSTLCDEEIALFDAFVPMTLLGRLAAAPLAARQAAKRTIKANPRLLAWAKWPAGAAYRLRRTFSSRVDRAVSSPPGKPTSIEREK